MKFVLAATTYYSCLQMSISKTSKADRMKKLMLELSKQNAEKEMLQNIELERFAKLHLLSESQEILVILTIYFLFYLSRENIF